ncbi:choice-of-anchor M domain-containing protein [Microbacterium album]|uniref:Surface-anchored protein n=1 Tax=Microbacterium album TaxID=2053191 RepID=A0A917II46_9MICO|nr:choice-of-anchor M domain-containing protein [Microbacterium album]GGH50676.1 hypothetical protein GCM10010921_29580 [Microbacterium album]
MTVLTRKRGAGALALLVSAALLIPQAAYAAGDTPVVYDDPQRFTTGHIDAFNFMVDADGSPRLVLKEDVTGYHVHRTPESVELYVKSQAISKNVPAGGVPAGAPGELYYLPLSQDHSLIWPGWDNQAVASFYGAGTTTDINITSVEGPGEIYLWTQGTFGGTQQLLTDSWKLPGTIHQTFGAHVHANWGFTQPGEYTLTVQGSVNSADGTQRTLTNTATYRFVVAPEPTAVEIRGAENVVEPGAEVTLTAAQLPEGADFPTYEWYTRASDSEQWERVTGAAPSITVQAIDGAQYRAVVAGGMDYATRAPLRVESAPVTIQAPAAPTPSVTIGRLAHHYHSGSPIVLTATAEHAPEGAAYRWTLQRTDQDAPVVLEQTGAEVRLTAEQALHGAVARVSLVDGETVLAESQAATIDVDDHGAAPLQKIAIQGVADHYHTGDTVSLTAVVDPASVLTRFEWYVQKQGQTAPELIEGENGSTYAFEATEELVGAAVIAKLTFDNGEVYVESPPVLIALDDHHEEPVATTLIVEGLADEYAVGDTATLTAVQDPETGEDHYHWFIKRAGDAEYSVIRGALSATLEHTVTAEDAGALIVAKLYDHDHAVIAESEPVALNVAVPGGQEPEPTKPAEAPAPQTGAALDGVPAGGIQLSDTTAAPGQVITVQVGAERAGEWIAAWLFSDPVLLGGDWLRVNAQGAFAVTIPADAEPGEHRLAVFAADGTLVGWETLQVSAPVTGGAGDDAADDDTAAAPRDNALAVTGAQVGGLAASGLALALLGAAVVLAARRRRGGRVRVIAAAE